MVLSMHCPSVAVKLSMHCQCVTFMFLLLLLVGKRIRNEQYCDDASSMLQYIRANELVVVLHRYGSYGIIHALSVCHFHVLVATASR